MTKRFTSAVVGARTHKDYYTYSAEVSTLTPNTTQGSIINIEADASFFLVKWAYFADIANATQEHGTRVVPLVDITVQDSGSGRNLQSLPVPIGSIAGIGALPFVLPVPREFKASSNISVNFNNRSASTTYSNVKLAFIGYKLFQYGPMV